jgi:hypothetical protein
VDRAAFGAAPALALAARTLPVSRPRQASDARRRGWPRWLAETRYAARRLRKHPGLDADVDCGAGDQHRRGVATWRDR